MAESNPQAATDHIVVYFCTGKTVVLPEAGAVLLRGDNVVCTSAGGVELAIFPAAEVYMCSRKQIPVAPL